MVNWFISFDIGVFQGCVISPTLFIIVFQILIDYIDQLGSCPYEFECGISDPSKTDLPKKLTLLQQAYVDDHTLIKSSDVGARHNLMRSN